MNEKIKAILNKMTVEEKAFLCSGKDFWHLKGIERLDVPSIMLADGPHGLRKQVAESNNVGLNSSIPTTCFPPAVTLASSWDRELIEKVGEAIAEECLQERVSVLLGPGANIKRSPLCGRNFEYFSEDPFLTSELATFFVKGVQSKGVGAALKHFVANNQETNRMTINTFVDNRALREIYFSAFEKPVKEQHPWMIMASYNKLNGEYVSENKDILTDILKKEWGFDGVVVTDWGASNNRVKGLKAGQDLEMPSSYGITDKEIIRAVNEGAIDENTLNISVARILDLIFKSKESYLNNYKYNQIAHHQLAKMAAAESFVLLKNDESILPIDPSKATLGLIGEFAIKPRYQGAGSSMIKPIHLETALEAYRERTNSILEFEMGYDIRTDKPNKKLIKRACRLAEKVDIPILLVGLTDDYESEGYDREHINMPESHVALIEAVLKANPNAVIVLNNGSPVSMPWLNKSKAVLECYLSGQAGASAMWEVIFGDVNPSGKLAETFPLNADDAAASKYFPMGPKGVEYRESIYVGYRYFEKANVKVNFPFGHGLSYSKFEYKNLKIEKQVISENETVEITLEIKNISNRAGKEIVQLYVRDVETTIFRPEKELKDFKKVNLEPGEIKNIKFELNKRSFAYFNDHLNDWKVESGEFEILVGASSSDIRLKESIEVKSTVEFDESINDLRESMPFYYEVNSDWRISKEDFEKLYGGKIVHEQIGEKGTFHRNSTVDEIRKIWIGKLIYRIICSQLRKIFGKMDRKQRRMISSMVTELPLRNFSMLSKGKINSIQIDGLIDLLNGNTIKGIKKILFWKDKI